MNDNAASAIPSELEYILQSCRAISEKRYEEALLLLKEGLRENAGIAQQIDTSELITLLRTLVVEIEIRADKDFGVRLRKLTEPQEPQCSFCRKHSSEVEKMIDGHGVFICAECIRTCSSLLEEKDTSSFWTSATTA